MRKQLLIIILSVLTSCPSFAGIHWSFGSANPLVAGSEPYESLQWTSAKKNIELVEGVKGTGLRTDGYSTWLSNTQNCAVSSISGYFALESFPTDTASYFAVRNTSTGESLSIAVEKYGKLLLVTGKDDKYSYQSLDGSVQRYKWSHIAVSMKSGKLYVYLDGVKIYRSLMTSSFDSPKQELLFCKGFQGRQNSRFQMAINGIIDELGINEALPQKKEIVANIAKDPVLAIPAIRYAGDYSRPKYHLIPGANWTNETHSLFYYDGRYHIFNQKNASNIQLRQINWGHYSSPDMVHWTEEKVALSPDMPYDKNGIWSGHAVINDDGIPMLFYTAGKESYGVGVAYPADDELIGWRKYEGNPVIDVKPDHFDRTDMRDQYVWKEGEDWYMIIGFGLTDQTPRGTLLMYKSKDLLDWEYAGLLYEGKPEVDQTGIFWEMPAFVKFGNKYFLSVNRVPNKGIPARTQYWIGNFDGKKFVPDNEIPQNLEVINGLLSPSFGQTPDGRWVTISIVPDMGGNSWQKGWAHLYSLPRVVDLKDGKIVQSPYPGLEVLRKGHFTMDQQTIESNISMPDMGHQYEIMVKFVPGDADKFGLVINKNPDGSEYTRIYFDRMRDMLVIDKEHMSAAVSNIPRLQQRSNTNRYINEDHYVIEGDEVTLHLYIDGSVVDGFINDEDAFTSRIYPSKENSTMVEIFSDGTDTKVSAEMWKISDAIVKMNY